LRAQRSNPGFDTIKEVGIGGNYICEDHTIKYLRDSYRVSDFFTANTWEASKDISTLDLAHEYVEKVTKGYKDMEPVVDSSTYEELTRILNEAEKELAQEREKK
jgi:trimethylamine--corrinoid protein Co-methyltransferase